MISANPKNAEPKIWPLILALHKVNLIAVTRILVLHVGNGRSERLDNMFLDITASCFLAVRAVRACAQRGSGRLSLAAGEPSTLPGKRVVWGAAGSPILYLAKI